MIPQRLCRILLISRDRVYPYTTIHLQLRKRTIRIIKQQLTPSRLSQSTSGFLCYLVFSAYKQLQVKHTEAPKPLYPVNATVSTSASLKPSGAHHPPPTTVTKEPVVAAKPSAQLADKSQPKYVRC